VIAEYVEQREFFVVGDIDFNVGTVDSARNFERVSVRNCCHRVGLQRTGVGEPDRRW
jgi:hypothetical protein